MTENRLAAEH